MKEQVNSQPKQFKPRRRSQRNKLVQVCQFIATNAAGLEALSAVAPAVIPPGTGAAVAAVCGIIGMGINQFYTK